MKKRVINHAVDIAKSAPAKLKVNGFPCQYWHEGHMFVTDGCRLMEVEHLIDELVTSENQDNAMLCVKSIEEVNNSSLDYLRIENIPSVNGIKSEIKNLVGRKLDTIVYNYEGVFAVNARYLYKALEALNASCVYVSRTKPGISPIFIFEDGNPQSTVKEMILPIRVNLYVPGFSVIN